MTTRQDDPLVRKSDAGLALLDAEVSRFLERADLPGLVRTQEAALEVAKSSTRRTRKRAVRIVERARTGIEQLRQDALDQARAADAARAFEVRLREQFKTTLELLMGDGVPPRELQALEAIAKIDPDGRIRLEAESTFDVWSPLIFTGYEHSRRIFGGVSFEGTDEDRREIERALKTIAVDLMAAGTAVRALTTDAVPLIAYAVFSDLIPVPPEFISAVTQEKIDDLLLSMGDGVSERPPTDRRLFVSLFRVAILLGEAQTYADLVGLPSFSLFAAPTA